MTTTDKPKRVRKPKAEKPAEIVSYKAFDKNLQCRGFQYAVGETYEHPGPIAMCSRGFHSCTELLDVLNYHDITESRFAVVKASGAISEEGAGDSKICSASLHIEAELTLPDFIKRAISAITAACKVVKPSVEGGSITKGHSATNASSGDSAKNEATGKHAVIAAVPVDTWVKALGGKLVAA